MIDRIKPSKLMVGARVELTFDPTRQGTVVTVGPEVSEIKLADGTRRLYSNTHLRMVKVNKPVP